MLISSTHEERIINPQAERAMNIKYSECFSFSKVGCRVAFSTAIAKPKDTANLKNCERGDLPNKDFYD